MAQERRRERASRNGPAARWPGGTVGDSGSTVMPALNFQKRFAHLVESGQKCQTIRAPRIDGKPNACIGDTLYLYTGMRTKGCRKLGKAICAKTSQVVITHDWRILVNGILVKDGDGFARADGFSDMTEMFDWFHKTHGLPFEGSLIEWSVFETQPDGSKSG